MQTWQGALVIVVALAVGVAIPALVQLALALRSARTAADRATRALETATQAAERLDRLAARIEKGGQVDSLLGAVDLLSKNLQRLGETARVVSAVGGALGPAVGAAVRAWRSSQDGANDARDGTGASPPPETQGQGGES